MNLLEVTTLGKHYPIKRFLKPDLTVKALDGVSFTLEKGKTLAVVGESGCGKSTLAKLLTLIEGPSFGEVKIAGQLASSIPASEYRSKVQMIFQDPYSSLNPRKKIKDIVAEPLVVNTNLSGSERLTRVHEMLSKVGLRPHFAERYPHMLSGGQRQRIGIARALMLRPELLICDEPVSALFVANQDESLHYGDFDLRHLVTDHKQVLHPNRSSNRRIS